MIMVQMIKEETDSDAEETVIEEPRIVRECGSHGMRECETCKAGITVRYG